MPNESAKLKLPYIQYAQAQKHVTHNEALRVLDILVQTCVKSKDVNTPPSQPSNGDTYVILGSGTNEWAGHEGKLAVWDENTWVFYTPNEGWTVWVGDLNALWSYDGESWVETTATKSWQNQPLLGLNTTADTLNRFSVSSPATLLNHEGGDHQLKINKASSDDTASLLFQNSWTGHTEMGLIGNSDFSIKTSDGNSWFTSLKCASIDGQVSFPAGLNGRIEVFGTGNSVFLGDGAGEHDDLSDNRNIFIGLNAGNANTSGYSNCITGSDALRSNTTGFCNNALGDKALYSNSTGYNNSASGYAALYSNTTGYNNSASGYAALYHNTTGFNNCALGYAALYANMTGSNNFALGSEALRFNTTGYSNCALGTNALRSNTTGFYNSAIVRDALRYTTTGTNNVSYNNCVGLGYNTRVSASNQVQLGNSSSTVYAHGSIQDRSDARDKADVRDTVLGLDFITRLRPVDFRWDMRDDYFDEIEEIDRKTGETVLKRVQITKDGSRKRKRFHHGLIAQEVAAVIQEMGIDFGGYQNHNYAGDGEDVLSLGYVELITPLIRAVQELAMEINTLKKSRPT